MDASDFHRIAISPVEVFLDPSSRLYVPYLGSAALLAFLVERRDARAVWGVTAVRQVGRLMRSRSIRIDALLLVINALVAALATLPMTALGTSGAILMARAIQACAGTAPYLSWNGRTVAVLFTCALFLMDDITRYGLHRAMHRFAFLWRLHQVHHGATLMTPLTFKRVHPLEAVLFSLRHALCVILVGGGFLWAFRGFLSGPQALGLSAGTVAFHALGANLRHSHVRWTWGERLEKWLISPAAHQLHHSRNPLLQNRNYGSILAVWDVFFGSHHAVPKKGFQRFGLYRYGGGPRKNQGATMNARSSIQISNSEPPGATNSMA